MKPKAIIKILVDILMTLALLLLMGFQFWGDVAHEWIGMEIFLLFIVHHIFNRHWYKKLFRGRYAAIRICGIVMNVILLITMLMLAYSSVVMSRYVFDFLEIGGGMSLARRLHILASYWGFIFMSIHLGLHWSMIIGMTKKCMRITKASRIRSILLLIIGFLIAGYGAYAFSKRDFLIYMFLQSEFVFLDYRESPVLFYVDYLALMGLFIFIVYYIQKTIRNKRKLEGRT